MFLTEVGYLAKKDIFVPRKKKKMTPSERQEYREKLIKEGKYTWGEYEVWE